MSERQVNRRRYDQERRDAAPWRAWYKAPAWRRIRRNQFKAEPNCRFCAELGRIRAATIVDHVRPHRGNWLAFWAGPFQSLCKDCHDGRKQREERDGFSRRVGEDGWPSDPLHPFNEEG